MDTPLAPTPAPDVGLDASAEPPSARATLDVAVLPTGEAWQTANDPASTDDLTARIGALAPGLVVLEATGRYEAPRATALAAADVPVAVVNQRVVNPQQVRDFAKATGRLAKTGAIDAAVLTLFAPPAPGAGAAGAPGAPPARWRRGRVCVSSSSRATRSSATISRVARTTGS